MKILAAHTDKQVLGTVRTVLTDAGRNTVDCTDNHQETSANLAGTRYDLVVMQYSLIGKQNIAAIIRLAQSINQHVSVWVVGGSFTQEATEVSLAAGAEKVLTISNVFSEFQKLGRTNL